MSKAANGWDIFFVSCVLALYFYLLSERLDDVDDALTRIEQRLAECKAAEE